MDKEAVLRRIDELHGFSSSDMASINRVLAGLLTLVEVVHGPESFHLRHLKTAAEDAQLQYAKLGLPAVRVRLVPVLRGFLDSLRSDVEAGLSLTGERRGFGAALSDFLGLAKDALEEETEDAKNVAAVLVAASFEDAIRRMGGSLAGVTGRPDLSHVIDALKKAGILQGSPLSTALGYLKFRNDALHADWSKIDRAVVGSCLAFVEGLLVQHFA